MNFEEEREKRAYMKGPDLGIHPKANGEGNGQKTELREVVVTRKPMAAESATRVFV